jgi:hypothetical protein
MIGRIEVNSSVALEFVFVNIQIVGINLHSCKSLNFRM